MRRTEQVQGLRLMKFEEVYGRTHRGGLSQAEGAEVLGVSERTFRRWRDRYEAEGADGLYDRRLGRLSARRAPVDEVARVLELFGLLGLHGQALPREAGGRSRLQAQLQLAAAELASPWAQARGAQAWGAPAQAAAPCPARMMLHRASSHEWVPGRWWDLIVTMDDATAISIAEEGGAVRGDPGKGLFCSLYADRASWNTPEAGGKVDKVHPDPGRPRPGAARHRVDPGHSPEARGRSERMFGTLQNLPHARSSITDMVEANLLKEVFLPQHNVLRDPGRGPGHCLRPLLALDDILWIHEERTVQTTTRCATSAWHFRSPPAATAAIHVKARVRVHEYPDGTMAVFHGPRCLARYHAMAIDRQPNPRGRVTVALRRDRPAPCGQVDSRSATTLPPQKPQQKRSTHMVHKPVNQNVLDTSQGGRGGLGWRCN